MKVIVNAARVLVGLLFIFSGLVKANDPIGLAYKMQEFFLVWGLSVLDGIALPLSVLMIAFEIFAGAALLLGWKKKSISWLLLLLILFFTFLTGYAYLSGKFKNCGCFGDCIPITAGQSFIKDVLLLLLILIIFFNTRYIKPLFSKGLTTVLLLLVTVFSFASQWYTLQFLPVADCLPLKKGNSIPAQLKMPANAVPDSTVITFIYEKQGKKVEFTADAFPDDFDDSLYQFVDRYDKVIRPGKNNEPPLKNFAISAADGTDMGASLLRYPQVLVLFVENATTVDQWKKRFEKMYPAIAEKNISFYMVTSTKPALEKAIAGANFDGSPIWTGDATMIRIAARTNPTLYLLKNGVVEGKWSYRNFDDALETIHNLATETRIGTP